MSRTFSVQLRKELTELWRTRKMLVVVAVLVAFGFMSPLFAKILPDLFESMGEQQANVQIIFTEPTVKDALDQFVKNITQFGLLLAVLMSFGTVVNEREHGQASLMFTHPLPRTVFVLAKFAALAILFGIALLLGAAADLLYTVLLFEAPDMGGFLALVGLIYVWMLALIAISLLASTLGRSITAAGGLAFLLVVILLIAGSVTHYAPDALLGWGHSLAIGTAATARWGALIITLALIVLGVGGSAAILRRQEIG